MLQSDPRVVDASASDLPTGMSNGDSPFLPRLRELKASFGFDEGAVNRCVAGGGPFAEPNKQNTESIGAADNAASFVGKQGRSELFARKWDFLYFKR